MSYAHCICDTSNMAGTKLPSKLVNVKLSANVDNGNIVAIGNLATGEVEALEATQPEATTPITQLALVKAPEVMADETKRNLGDFYNKNGEIVRAYLFESGDEFRLTAEGIDGGTPSVGHVLEAQAGYKMKTAASATGSGTTLIGTVIAIEGDYFVVRVA